MPFRPNGCCRRWPRRRDVGSERSKRRCGGGCPAGPGGPSGGRGGGRAPAGPSEPKELDDWIVYTNETLGGLRDLARGFSPPLLAEQGVVAALGAHIRKVGANATVEASIGFADRRFDPDAEAGVYF